MRGRGPVVTLALNQAPRVIANSIRAVLEAHGYVLARVFTQARGRTSYIASSHELVELDQDVRERVLRELGNNVAQALFAISLTDD